jgi:hypothetical protein
MAGFGEVQSRTYFKIKDGKIVARQKQGDEYVEVRHGKFEGELIGIGIREGEYDGKPTKNWELTFLADGKEYVWQPFYNSLIAQGFFNSLAGHGTTLKGCMIGLFPYEKNEHTNLWIKINNVDAKWKYTQDEMPRVEKQLKKNGEVLGIDDTERMEWVESVLVAEVAAMIESDITEAQTQPNAVQEPDNDDLHETEEAGLPPAPAPAQTATKKKKDGLPF